MLKHLRVQQMSKSEINKRKETKEDWQWIREYLKSVMSQEIFNSYWNGTVNRPKDIRSHPSFAQLSWLCLTQLRPSSSPQPSRSFTIWFLWFLLLLNSLWFCPTGLLVTSWTPQTCSQLCTRCFSFLEHASTRRHFLPPLQALSMSTPTHPDHPIQSATGTPIPLLYFRIPSSLLSDLLMHYRYSHSQGQSGFSHKDKGFFF